MKKILCVLCSVLILLQASALVLTVEGEGEKKTEQSEEGAAPQDQSQAAEAEKRSVFTPETLPEEYVVIDAETGSVVLSQNEHNKNLMGNMASIMTALLLIENRAPQDKLSSAPDFRTPPGVSIAVDAGEEFTLEALLHALLLSYANDAAETLAYAHSGSVDEFAKAMNERAAKLGMKDTNFISPYNVAQEAQVTSVFDVALMLREASKFEGFKAAVSAPEYKIPPTNKKSVERNYIKQNNAFLLPNGRSVSYLGTEAKVYDEAVSEAGLSVLSNGRYLGYTSLDFEKMSLILVSAGAGNADIAYAKQKALIEKMKSEYASYSILVKGDFVEKLVLKGEKEAAINMVAGGNLNLILPKAVDLEREIKREVKKRDLKNLVIEKGVKLGELSLIYRGRELGKVPLLAEQSSKNSAFLGELSNEKAPKTPLQKVLMYLGIALKILIILILWVFVVSRHRARLRRKRKTKNRTGDVQDLLAHRK